MRGRLIEDAGEIRALVKAARRIGVLGIKTEAQATQPAYYVPAYLARAGLEVVPIPVKYPEATSILGVPVVRRVADAPGPLDVVVVFRRPADLHAHLSDLLAAHPKAVWLQLGIRSDEFARALTDAGIDVVMDRCFMVEHRAAS